MAQRSSIVEYIKLWLPFTPLIESQQRLVLECIETGCIETKDTKKLDTESSKLLFLISSFCHLDSYYLNTDEYSRLEEIIQLKIQGILKKLKIDNAGSRLDCTTIACIITFNLFKACCENTNTLIIEKNTDTITLLKFLDDAADLIYHQLNILGAHLGIYYDLDINKIKDVIVKLLSVIKKENIEIFSLESVEYYKTLKWGDHKNDKSFINGKQLYKKSLIIKHTFVVIPNYGILFKLCPDKPLLLITKSASYITTNFPPFVCNVIKQHRDRPHTICKDEFYKSLISLAQVKMNLSYELLEKQWSLVELDMANSMNLIADHKNKTNYSDLVQILGDVLITIQTTSKNITKNSINANFIREKAKNHIQDNKSIENNIKHELEYSQILVNLKKRWDSLIISSIYKDKERIVFQKIFSKFYQYYIFRKFMEYVKINNINSWYFLPYADFRGRFYYDSVASPQSFWGFRHIYMCENAEFCEESYFRAIGILFKKEITNEKGELQLDKLIALGQNKHATLCNLTMTQLYTNLKDLTLLAEFIYYKHALEKPNEAYFVWADTTCSMAQHAVKVLGFKENALKYINLDNDNIAYDTYTIYINELKKILKKSGWSDTQLSYLTRGLLKHVIMTVGYGVTFYTAYTRHKRIAADLFSDIEVFNWITSKEVFKEIFIALTEGQLDELFYQDTKSNWIHNQNIDETFNLPDMILSQVYLSPSIKLTNLELNPIDGKRQHHQISVHLDYNCDKEFYIKHLKEGQLYDKDKTKRSIYVNTIHALDAYYMRNIIREIVERGYQIIAVHDGFAVPPSQRHWLISIANMVFNKPNPAFSYSNSILI